MPLTATYVGEFGSGDIGFSTRLAVDPTTGDVLVGDTDATAILRYDSGGTLLDTYDALPAPYGDGISGISVTSAGKIWATNFYTRNDSPPSSIPSLYRLAADGTFEDGFYYGPLASTVKVMEPNYVHVGGDGKVYVASTLYNCAASPQIQRALGVRHDSAGAWEADIGAFFGCDDPFPLTAPDGLFVCPGSISTDSAGNVYVADLYNDGVFETSHRYKTIHKFNSSGTFQFKFGGVGTDPGQFSTSGLNTSFFDGMGMAIDAADNIYVADTYGGKINVYDTSGAFLMAFGTDESLSYPGDIACGADGAVYVIDADRVVAYTVAGPAGMGVRGVSIETCGEGPC